MAWIVRNALNTTLLPLVAVIKLHYCFDALFFTLHLSLCFADDAIRFGELSYSARLTKVLGFSYSETTQTKHSND